MTDAQNIQDHPLDESTGIQPQHFDADGYVVGHPHHDTVASDELGPDGLLSQPDEIVTVPEAGTQAPASPDGQFDSQRMPTTDGELSEPDGSVVADADASIAPPPAGPPAEPVPGAPDGVPIDPDITPDEPAPFAPDEAAKAADPQRTVGGTAFH